MKEHHVSALMFVESEMNFHIQKLIELNKKLEILKGKAHDLSTEYAESILTENAKEIGVKSEEVGIAIADLEREINKTNAKIDELLQSTKNVNGFIENYDNPVEENNKKI